jgi:peptide deformylase
MLKLRYYGDPILTRRTTPVEVVDDEVRALAAEMFKVMAAARGVGLAANQVGVPRRVLVMDPSGGREKGAAFALINPRITSRTGAFTDEEGCLSFPGLRLELKRSLDIRAEGLDLDGNRVAVEASGLVARVFQHELDHLEGLLLIDRVSPEKRAELLSLLDRGGAAKTAGTLGPQRAR